MNRPCKELKRVARQNLSRRFGTPMAALLISGTIPLAAEFPFSMLQQTSQPLLQTIIFYAANFLISLLSIVLSVGLSRLHLALARGEKYDLGMVFWAFKNHPDRYIAIGFLLFIIDLAAMLPMIAGWTLLNVPDEPDLMKVILVIILTLVSAVLALIAQLCYAPAFFLNLDHPQMSAFETLKASRRLMRGHKGRLFYIYLSFLGMALLSVLTLGLGCLWVMPYQTQTLTNFYLDIIGELK